jgi:cyanophycin synthetase
MGDVVYLKSTANLSTGGTSVDVTDMLHPENIFLAERISIGCLWCGYYGREFNAALKDNGGVILEVNAAPGFRMHLAV